MTIPETPEADLARRAAAGDQDAFRRLYERHERMILHVAYRITGNRSDAEDLLQETFLTAHERLPLFEGRSRFSTWLTGIAVHKSINHRQKIRNRFTLLRRYLPTGERETEAAPETAGDEVRSTLESLSSGNRALLVLRYGMDFSYEELAETLGCPVGTIKSRLFKLHQDLHRQEDKEGKGKP